MIDGTRRGALVRTRGFRRNWEENRMNASARVEDWSDSLRKLSFFSHKHIRLVAKQRPSHTIHDWLIKHKSTTESRTKALLLAQIQSNRSNTGTGLKYERSITRTKQKIEPSPKTVRSGVAKMTARQAAVRKKVNRSGSPSLSKTVGGVCWKTGWVSILSKAGRFSLDLEVPASSTGSSSRSKAGPLCLWGLFFCGIGFDEKAYPRPVLGPW